MKFYIDDDYCCHIANPNGNFREVEHPFFDGMCKTFIEGFRFVPDGESWTRSDGYMFNGEMISAWKPYEELAAAQREYERQQLAAYEAALSEIEAALGVI